MNSKAPQKAGQGLLETILILPIAVALVLSLLSLSYRGLIYYSGHYILSEALICTDDLSAFRCQKLYSDKFKKLLLFKEIFKLQISKSKSLANGSISVKTKSVFTSVININTDIYIFNSLKFPISN